MTAPWDDPRVVEGLERQLAERRRLLDAGAAHVGWKVGLGSEAVMETLSIGAPLVGFLTDRTGVESGGVIDADHWERGLVEFEIAVYMGRDLGPGASDREAADAVAALGPAIEVANADLPLGPDSVADILAGDVFHRATVLGASDPARAGIDLSGLTGRVSVDGEERAVVDDVATATAPLEEIVRVVADTLASRGELLSAGDVVLTGTIVPPIPVSDGSTFGFALEPFDPISVGVRR